MADEIRAVPDTPTDDQEPDTVGTPEGDNEIPPDQPLEPAADAASEGLQTPPGSGVGEYRKD